MFFGLFAKQLLNSACLVPLSSYPVSVNQADERADCTTEQKYRFFSRKNGKCASQCPDLIASDGSLVKVLYQLDDMCIFVLYSYIYMPALLQYNRSHKFKPLPVNQRKAQGEIKYRKHAMIKCGGLMIFGTQNA